MRKVFLIVFIIIFMTVVVGCTQVELPPLEVPQFDSKEIGYYTEEVKITTELIEYITKYAKVEPIQEENILFDGEQSGYISEVFVKRNDLVKKGDLIALIDYGELSKLIRDAQIELDIEQKYYEKLKYIYETTGSGKYNLDIATLDLKVTQYNYDKIVAEIEKYSIVAPLDGTITYLGAIVDKLVVNGTRLCEVSDNTGQVIIVRGVLEDVPSIAIGDILPLSKEDLTASGKVIEINYQDDEVIVEYIGEVDPTFYKIGSTLKVDLIKEQLNNIIAVNVQYITEVAGNKVIDVLENNVLVQKEITVGKKIGNMYEILLGLNEGDLIITEEYVIN